jgi:D-3-phosphoglycerate dehydrogenase / 2-oxoglutarate reductase
MLFFVKYTMKIAISPATFARYSEEPLALLRAAHISFCCNPHGRTLKEAEVSQLLHGCCGLLAGTEPLTASVFAANPQLRVVSRCGTGTDAIDKQALTQHGIALYTTPDAPTRAAAEHSLGLMLALLRHIPAMDAAMHKGEWHKCMGNLLYKKKVGIIGYGRIGHMVAGYVQAFGAECAYTDPITHPEASCPALPLEALLAWADIITLHCPAQPEGQALITRQALHYMRAGTWLINTARGSLVDEEALIQALSAQHLAGAALDVFTTEPCLPALQSLPNLILTPHAASYAQESRIAMEVSSVQNLIQGLTGDRP